MSELGRIHLVWELFFPFSSLSVYFLPPSRHSSFLFYSTWRTNFRERAQRCCWLSLLSQGFKCGLPFSYLLKRYIRRCKTLLIIGTSLMAQLVKCLPAMQEMWVWSLGQEDPLEKEIATHSSTLAWKIPWMEEPGRLQSIGLQRVGHDWATSLVNY